MTFRVRTLFDVKTIVLHAVESRSCAARIVETDLCLTLSHSEHCPSQQPHSRLWVIWRPSCVPFRTSITTYRWTLVYWSVVTNADFDSMMANGRQALDDLQRAADVVTDLWRLTYQAVTVVDRLPMVMEFVILNESLCGNTVSAAGHLVLNRQPTEVIELQRVLRLMYGVLTLAKYSSPMYNK